MITTKKLARMRRMSTTIELNDISRVSSATTVRLHHNPQRPSSVPLDSYNISMDTIIMQQNNQKYLQVFPPDDQQSTERRLTMGSMCSIQENSNFVNNNNLNNCNTSVANISASLNPSASSANANSLKLLITTKIQLPKAVKKIISGLVLVLIVSASSTGAIQLAKITLMDQNFYAPYFLAWFWINLTIFTYPIYITVTLIHNSCRSNMRKTSKDTFREAKMVYNSVGGGPSSRNSVITKTLLFTVLWIISNYMYCLSLGYLSPSETSALFVSHPAFIYLISWIYFHDTFVSARIIAVLLSIIGVVLMAHATGIGTTNFIGIVAAVVSSSIAAIFKILFKSFFGEPSLNQISFIFTMLGLSNLIFNWPLTFILYITSAEKIIWLSAPWKFICLSSALALVWQLLTNLGKNSKNSVFISVGLFISLPLNAVVDFGLRSSIMGTFQIIGSVCILISCILLLLPADFTNRFPGSLIKSDL